MEPAQHIQKLFPKNSAVRWSHQNSGQFQFLSFYITVEFDFFYSNWAYAPAHFRIISIINFDDEFHIWKYIRIVACYDSTRRIITTASECRETSARNSRLSFTIYHGTFLVNCVWNCQHEYWAVNCYVWGLGAWEDLRHWLPADEWVYLFIFHAWTLPALIGRRGK